MPIDGIVVRNIVKELNDKLINARIDKVTQPEIDEINIIVRNEGQNFKLLLTSNANYPRVHLTDIQKQSPLSAPMFCMVLRKHLSGGRIIKIEQYTTDRIMKFYIEGYDELGTLSNKILICEIMGRHSNIILVNEATNEIIDSIKHIHPDMSSFRLVLPGIKYKDPPFHDKIEPLYFDSKEFINRINLSTSNIKLEKFISQVINGISILAAREMCYNAGLYDNITIQSLNSQDKDNLLNSINNFISDITNYNFTPSIYYSKSVLYDFYSLNLNHLGSMDIEHKQSICEIIDIFYRENDRFLRIKQKSAGILKVVSGNLERCLKKLSIQDEKLLECTNKDHWKVYGDLVMSNLYAIKKGDNKAILLNFYTDNQEMIEIQLDILLTPVQNAQRYYKKYSKQKSAEIFTASQRTENLLEIEYLESQLVNLSNCTEDEEIDEIKTELISLGYIKYSKKGASRKQKPSKPMHYISSDGMDIFVGKNNVQNDYLTTKFADSSDIWMHTKKIPGSHVIIKNNNNSVSDITIMEAASLCAYYSKARSSSNVPVDYTEKKNVKKPSGAKPGMVVYYTNKTVYITPNEGMINELKKI